jgi:integrase
LLLRDEQSALIAACPLKLRCLVMLLQLTGARVDETLALTWDDISEDGVLTFRFTKTGKIRCGGGTDEIVEVLNALPRTHTHVFASPRTGTAYMRTVSARCSAGQSLSLISMGTVCRFIRSGIPLRRVWSRTGLESGRRWARFGHTGMERTARRASDEGKDWGKSGGRQEARTPDLRVANAALSQLS